jgi:hypothetical protein
MRTFTKIVLGTLIVTGCGEVQDPSILEAPSPEGPGTTAGLLIVDGASGEAGGNPHFFFLPPVAENTPNYTGIQDDGLEPTVTVCYGDAWEPATETCGGSLAEFSGEPDSFGNTVSVTEGLDYSVVWKTNEYPAQDGEPFAVVVSVVGKVLGWATVKAYDPATYASFQYTDPEGNIAISTNGNLNIKFRIEDGFLESEYCDPNGIEDCDVELLTYEESACLRVFENPGQAGEALGSQACVPAGQAKLNGQAVAGEYAAIFTLEEGGTYQGGLDPSIQIPFFPDFQTDPPGISFGDPDTETGGVPVVICQIDDQTQLPDDYHPFLRPFIVYSDGTKEFPEDFSYGSPECEGFTSHGHTVASAENAGSDGFLGRFASRFSKVSSFFLPKPLVARRIHGGLNTTVYNTKGDASPEGEAVSPFETGGEEIVVELGSYLDVDAGSSDATVPGTGQVGQATTITILAQDPSGALFTLYEVPVTVTINAGTANEIIGTVQYDGDGVYTATYTPTSVGADAVTVTIDGFEMAGSPFTSNIAPRNISAENSSFEVSYSEVGLETTVTVEVRDTEDALYIYGENFPIGVQVEVVGPNGTTIPAVDEDENGDYDGIYVASFSPSAYGEDVVTVTITVGTSVYTVGVPFTLVTAPRPVDPSLSSATLLSVADVPAGDGQMESQTDITILVRNEADEVYDYASVRPIDVQVSVSGTNPVEAFSATDAGGGTYTAAYTPMNPGTDYVSVTIDGAPISGSPYTHEVRPLFGDINVTVNITGPGVAPADGLPVNLYDSDGNPALDREGIPMGTAFTDGTGMATFSNVDFGTYTVYLPKRDFDMDFLNHGGIQKTLEHNNAPSSITFDGHTDALPPDYHVYRIKNGGNGNVFQYVLDNRSWTSAENQIRGRILWTVPANLASIASAGENAFVAALVAARCPNETNEKKCKNQGWIGLSDEASEGNWEWTDGSPFVFSNWKEGEPSGKNNEDHVEINLFGFWTDENGASSTNEGFVEEYPAAQPLEHPAGMGGS